ncbi:MAG TPA: trypsin-like serine protease [Kofleriaceae bacterium]
MSRALGFLYLFVCSISYADSAEAPVVGGTPVPAGNWRDVVAVFAEDSICSGTLIAPDVVLTAGHCVEAGPIEVLVDTVDYGDPGGDIIPVKWSRAYPDWQHRYDIGVIMLEHVARPKPRMIASACTTRELLVAGAEVRAVGFGLASESGSDHNTQLREAVLPVIDPTCTLDAACESSIAPHGEFIAGGNGTDTCFGDSGGPIFIDTPEGPALVGVVSRGLATPGLPCANGGVYVRADKVTSWLKSVTGSAITRTSCEGRTDSDPSSPDSGGCSSASRTPGVGAIFLALLVLFVLVRGSFRWHRRNP